MSVTQIPASTADVKTKLASTIVLAIAATVESTVTSSKVKQVIDKWLYNMLFSIQIEHKVDL